MSSEEIEALKSKITSLEKEINLLQSDNEAKARLIDIYENKIETLQKLSEISGDTESLSNISSPIRSSIGIPTVRKTFQEKVKEVEEAITLEEAVTLYAKKGSNSKSYRDEMEARGIKISYNLRPIGTTADGKEVELKKIERTNFKEK